MNIFNQLKYFFFFFNDTATTEIYTLSLHDALPISRWMNFTIMEPMYETSPAPTVLGYHAFHLPHAFHVGEILRSEEHTSELQSQSNLVCRLLLEKKNHRYNSTF